MGAAGATCTRTDRVASADLGITFNGTNAYFSNTSAQASMDPGTGSFVIEFDAKISTVSNEFSTVLSAGAEEGIGGVDIYVNGTNFLRFEITDAADLHFAEVYANLSSIVNDGLKHRVACVYDAVGATVKVFVDDALSDTGDASDMAGQSMAIPKLFIGKRTTTGSTLFIGTMYGMNWMNGTTTRTSGVLAKTAQSVLFLGMQESSGNIVDSVSAITLTANGSPVYSVGG